jgi:hypothetical protein
LPELLGGDQRIRGKMAGGAKRRQTSENNSYRPARSPNLHRVA